EDDFKARVSDERCRRMVREQAHRIHRSRGKLELKQAELARCRTMWLDPDIGATSTVDEECARRADGVRRHRDRFQGEAVAPVEIQPCVARVPDDHAPVVQRRSVRRCAILARATPVATDSTLPYATAVEPLDGR